MKQKTRQQISNMSLEEAKLYIGKMVYEATKVIEILENCGKCLGNGHHARQKLAKVASQELEDRWK